MTLDPLLLFVIPMGLALVFLFIAALMYDIRNFHRRKKKEESIYRCNDCHNIYTATKHTPLARCPKCGKQNAAAHHG